MDDFNLHNDVFFVSPLKQHDTLTSNPECSCFPATVMIPQHLEPKLAITQGLPRSTCISVRPKKSSQRSIGRRLSLPSLNQCSFMSSRERRQLVPSRKEPPRLGSRLGCAYLITDLYFGPFYRVYFRPNKLRNI